MRLEVATWSRALRREGQEKAPPTVVGASGAATRIPSVPEISCAAGSVDPVVVADQQDVTNLSGNRK